MIIKGKVNSFLEANTDTDVIIPGRFLKRTSLDGFEPFAFFEKRYNGSTLCEPSIEKKDFVFSKTVLNPDCSLNHKNTMAANFLITWFNFGCGSSREHAVYTLSNYKIIIGSSPEGKNAFADIFRDNCRQNLIWTPVIKEVEHKKLVQYFKERIDSAPVNLFLDTAKNILFSEDNEINFNYEMPENHKEYIRQAENKTPFEIAREGIERDLLEIGQWAKDKKQVLQNYPQVKV